MVCIKNSGRFAWTHCSWIYPIQLSVCMHVNCSFILNLAFCHFPEILWTLAPYNDELSFPNIFNSISAEFALCRKLSAKIRKGRKGESTRGRNEKGVMFCTNIYCESSQWSVSHQQGNIMK